MDNRTIRVIARHGNPILQDNAEGYTLYLALKAFANAHAHHVRGITLEPQQLVIEVRSDVGGKGTTKRKKYPKNANMDWVIGEVIQMIEAGRRDIARRADSRLEPFLKLAEDLLEKNDGATFVRDGDELVITYKTFTARANVFGGVVPNPVPYTCGRIEKLIEKSKNNNKRNDELERLRKLAKQHGLI